MKSNSLIIDVRHQLPWHRRYASNTSTMVMWGVWLLLWRPFILVWALIELEKSHLIHEVFHALSLGLEHALTSLAACAIALLLWSNYVPAKSIRNLKEKDLTDYARYFELDESNIHHGRTQKISTVHHDETGRITHID